MAARAESRRFLYGFLRGETFSPALAQERLGMVLVDANEPGEVAPSGQYEGRALPYGSAMVVLLDDDVPPFASALESLRALGEALPGLRALGVTEVTLSLVVVWEGSCLFVLSPEELGALAVLGLPLEVSCHPAAT